MATDTTSNPSVNMSRFSRIKAALTAENITKAASVSYTSFKDSIRVIAPDVVENAFYAWVISYAMFSADSKYLQQKEFDYQDSKVLNEANYVALGSVVVTTISHIAHIALRKINIFNQESDGKIFGHTRAMIIAGAFSYAFGSIKTRLNGS